MVNPIVENIFVLRIITRWVSSGVVCVLRAVVVKLNLIYGDLFAGGDPLTHLQSSIQDSDSGGRTNSNSPLAPVLRRRLLGRAGSPVFPLVLIAVSAAWDIESLQQLLANVQRQSRVRVRAVYVGGPQDREQHGRGTVS